MNFPQAIEVVQQYQQDYGFPGLLETLESMRDNLDELYNDQRIAFGVVFREMSKLFAPA